MHTYYFKFLYDTTNPVSGKFGRNYTGRTAIEATSYLEACKTVDTVIQQEYPNGSNIHNITQK